MLLKIIMLFLFLLSLSSIIYTLVIKAKKYIAIFRESLSYIKIHINSSTSLKTIKTSIISIIAKFKRLFPEILHIKSSEARDFVILLFSMSFIVLIADTPINTSLSLFLSIIVIILYLWGLARFFLYSPNDLIGKLLSLFIKWIILALYIVLLLQAFYTTNFKISVMAVIIAFSIVYSLILIKSILRDFKNRILQALNIFIGLALILFVIGFTFGSYFLVNNNVFELFTELEYTGIMKDPEIKASSLFLLIYKGLLYFYTFPLDVTLEYPITLILFFEYILGFIINVVVIGFLVSYFVSIQTDKEKKESTD